MKLLLIIAISVTMLGCSVNRRIEVTDTAVDDNMICRLPIDISNPNVVTWQPIHFYVLNKDIMKSIVDGDARYPSNLIAMDSDSYENLSLNIRQIINHMSEAKTKINELDEYYKKD